jgi:hypothetical protein
MKKEAEENFKEARRKLETELREHYEKHFAKQRKEIELAKKLLEKNKQQLEQERKSLLKKEKELRRIVEQQVKEKYRRQQEFNKKLLKRKFDELKEMRSKLKQQKLELRESLRKEIELKYDSRLQKERQHLEKLQRELKDKEFQFKVEKQELVDLYKRRERALERSIEDLKQQLERRTLQEIGDIPEEKLLDTLRKEFPEDAFERFGKGRAGGDVIQTIMLNGNPVGKVLYESKNERNWKYAWIEKIKSDRILVGTTYAILVSKAFPRDAKHFAIVKGVPVVSPRLLPHLARIIRSSIVAIEKQKLSAFEKEEKVSALYTYLNSNDFRTSVVAVGDSIEKLNKIRNEERVEHEKMWTKEEHEVNTITKHFTNIVSKINTIIETENKPLVIKKKNKEKILSEVNKKKGPFELISFRKVQKKFFCKSISFSFHVSFSKLLVFPQIFF